MTDSWVQTSNGPMRKLFFFFFSLLVSCLFGIGVPFLFTYASAMLIVVVELLVTMLNWIEVYAIRKLVFF